MKKTGIILAVLLVALSLAACKSESTSTTSFNVTTTTDEGTKEYNYKAEEKNGKVTTESSVTETPADQDTDEDSEEYETAEVINEESTDEDIDPAVMEEAEWIDDLLAKQWDNNNDGHSVYVDPDAIYVHIWSEGASNAEDLDQEQFRDEILPSWVSSAEQMREQFEEDGLGDLHLTIQYISDQSDAAFFTIEDEEVVFFVFD